MVNKITVALSLVVLLLCISNTTSAQSYQGGYLEGVVVDSDNDAPVENAKVIFLEHKAVSGSNRSGEFSLGGLDPGTYILVTKHDDYKEQTTRITIDEGYNSIRIRLEAAVGTQ